MKILKSEKPLPPRSIDTSRFWSYAFAYHGTATPYVLARVFTFGVIAALVKVLYGYFPMVSIAVGPIEVSGAVIALILILRTNSGYERWWEGRKLWGGIVNQSRNVVISALAYGPSNPQWRKQFVSLAAAFPHIARRSLRGERELQELYNFLGNEMARTIASSEHMPNYVAFKMAELLRQAREHDGMDGFSYLQVDRERALLIDHIGACERILKTPIAFAYAVKIRRFIVLYLILVPFALVGETGWLTPFITMFISYPILSLDHIGTELQNPFSQKSLSHLPLDEISLNIEKDLFALLELPRGETTNLQSAKHG